MNDELPDDLRTLDDEFKQAMRSFAPPADLDAGIVAHVSRRSRWLIMPKSGMRRAASAVVAASLLATVGYVADRQMNGGRSSLVGDLERLVAFDTRSQGEADEAPSEYYVQDDIENFTAGPEFKLRREEGESREATPSSDPKPGYVSDTYEASGGWFTATQGQSVGNGRDGRSEESMSGLNPSAVPTLQYGVVLSEATPYEGKQFSSNAGLEGSIVIDEQNLLHGPLHFEPGQISLRDNKAPPQKKAWGMLTKNRADDLAGSVSTHSDGDKDTTRSQPDSSLVSTPSPESVSLRSGNNEVERRPETGLVRGEGRVGERGEAGLDGAPTPHHAPSVAIRQKVIRSGTVEFEVDSFDSALMTISKLAMECGGFVASTDSAKLPNGKTRGAITLRVPPERLDALVLMLRGIGDLKSQKIAAQDVSKQYTDIESQLRAARAMEGRLLDMIQKGNGAIKELLAAEKELGVWREKIEKYEGEIRYYDNLIGLSTLTVVMQERDIKASAASIETETVSAGVETDDVEKGRAEILKAIDEAKGRILTSDLKKLDAGQFAATIVADVAPDRAGPVIDRLKQLGKLARLEVDRKQTSVDGTAAPLPGAKVEQRPTRFTISLYNLANVAPRLTTTATLASGDVEAGYQAVITLVEKAGGRIVTSQLQRPQADQVVANLQIEVPSAEAAASQAAITGLGEVMSLQLSENPDTANVTTAKQGFAVRIISSAGVAARETVTLQLASQDVVTAHRLLADLAAKVEARITQSNVTEGDGDNVNAVLQVDLPRTAFAEWDQARANAGDVLTRSVVRSTDLQNTLDSKLRIHLTLFPVDRLPPRQVTAATVVVRSSESQQQAFLAQATQLGGRVIDQTMSRDAGGRSHARVVFDVPRDKAATIFDAIRAAGDIRMMNTTTNPQAPDGPLARTRFELQFGEGEALVGAENSLWSSIKAGLATSLTGLGYSLRLLIVAICLVAPWALVLWGGWKLMRRTTKPPVA